MRKHKAAWTVSLGLAIVIGFAPLTWAGPNSEAQKMFADKCVRCHADNGSGDTAVGKALGAADLRTPVVQKLTDAQIYAQIDQGKGNMPPFGSGLSKVQINGLVAFVRSLAKTSEAAKHKPAAKRKR